LNRAAAYSDLHPGMFPVLLFSLSIFVLQPLAAQEKTIANSRISITVKERPFQEVLSIIEYKVPFKFAYSPDLIPRQKLVSVVAVDMPLQDLLTILLRGTPLTYRVIDHRIVLQSIMLPSVITLSGFVRDSRTGESLIGASIGMPGSGTGTFTNNYGFYSLTVPSSDTLSLEISYVGYKSLVRQIVTRSDLALSFDLEHNDQQEQIEKLTIASDKREDNIRKNQSSLVDMSTDMIAAAPSTTGTGDVIGSVELLPGVQAGIDGNPGYFIRGGNAGQNLILLDEANVYNPSHIFGLVGVFNPAAIKRVSLMKGGFPASYGDRLSSILDVVMKDGSNQQFGGIADLGSISSGMTFYGPLQTGKSSFLISARRSTMDLLLRPFLHQNYLSNYYFYDVNGKMNFTLSPKDRLLLSLYSGRDNDTYSSDSTKTSGINYSMNFGNTAFSLRWNHQYSGKLFSNTSVEYDRYHQFLSAAQQGYFAQLYSGIRDINAKTNLAYYLSPGHSISAGADYLYQTLYPATFSGQISSPHPPGIIPAGIPPKTATRLAVYASDEMKFGSRFQLNIGLRAPIYFKPGVQYLNIEPRLSLLYMIDPATSVKVSYSNMHQYIHLVQSYNSSFPAEIWIGSSNIVRPEASHEISAGLYKNFKENIFQTSVEFYYRQQENQLLFGGGTTPSINNDIENELIFGKAWSYGAEFFVRKNRGKWTGWLAYSFAYAWQHFDSLNLGQSFPFAYDRRHMLDISTAYTMTNHWRVAANLFLASGRAFTLDTDTTAVLNPGGNPLYDNRGRGRAMGRGRNQQDSSSFGIKDDNYRLSPYNRLDLSIRYRKTRNTSHRVLETEWIFSVYNVYARANSSFVYRTIDPSTGKVVANQVPFIPVVPNISYSLKF
jgi:TonB dependent receptor/CarboxypepD_reg-like domain/TonB-dependent Receptor Plug Domain